MKTRPRIRTHDPWSSAKRFVGDVSEDLLAVDSDMFGDITDRRAFLLAEEDSITTIGKHTRTGRPLGSEALITHLEQAAGRVLLPRKRGLKSVK